jgi:hypothetical protein
MKLGNGVVIKDEEKFTAFSGRMWDALTTNIRLDRKFS